jgi:uncharacterized membrane protein
MRSTVTIMIALWIMVSTVTTVIALRFMVSTVTTMIPLRVMVSTVTATMTGPMMVVVSLVLVVVVVAMVAVIKNRAQCDKRNRRRDNAVIMIRASRCAGKGQGNQAANRYESKLVGLQLFHFNLHFMSTMAPM